ncbi:MAG TPA: formyltetrahydrofolate deformylase [Acidimicrobiales bacterium]|nr:formyltetrahydrofolate deformylase [Acidimicrobiales bacterium]
MPGLGSAAALAPDAGARPRAVLTLACDDRVGIVRAVAGYLADRGVNIDESQQFASPSGRFFMRVEVSLPAGSAVDDLRSQFVTLARDLGMSWGMHDSAVRPRLLLLVSRLGHCLNDLLYRWRVGSLRADIAAVVSNHPDFEELVASYGIAFHHLPVTDATRAEQESRLVDIVTGEGVDLVVLARYMQILSPELAGRLAGRAINIHHSFLPSFKGARPYHQAYEHGVKLIGATAHYVTADLDEGPIIEQEVARVEHRHTVDQLVAIGRDIECAALARAVTWHVEHRVMLNGRTTVVFP